MAKASDRLSSAPPPPWTLTGTVALCLYLRKSKEARSVLPVLLEPVPVLPGHTLGGYLLGRFRFEDEGAGSGSSFPLMLEIAALARQGKQSGWFVSRAFVQEAGVYGGLKEVWGFASELSRMAFHDGRGTCDFSISKGLRFLARSRFRPLGPQVRIERSLVLLSEKQRRLHKSVLDLRGPWRWALSSIHMRSDPRLLPKPRWKVISFLASDASLTLHAPEDIDLRGYRPD